MDKNADTTSSQQGKLPIETSETFKFVIESLTDGVAIADMTGKLIYINPAAEKIVGMKLLQTWPQEWQKTYGLFMEDMVTPFPQEQYPIVRGMKGEITKGVIIYVKNIHLEKGIFITSSGGPIKDALGNIIGGLAVFVDITQEREREAKFKEKVQIEAKMNTLFLDREEAMKELKKENEELKAKLKDIPAA